MKKIILVVFVATLFVSCEKNKIEQEKESNIMVFNGKTYALKSGAIHTFNWKYGDNSGTSFSFVFVDSDFPDNYWGSNNLSAEQLQKTKGVTVVICSFDKNGDEFDYKANKTTCVKGHGDTELNVNYNPVTDTFEDEYEFDNCDFCVVKDGSNFIVDFKCKTSIGIILEVHYAGRLYEYETSDDFR